MCCNRKSENHRSKCPQQNTKTNETGRNELCGPIYLANRHISKYCLHVGPTNCNALQSRYPTDIEPLQMTTGRLCNRTHWSASHLCVHFPCCLSFLTRCSFLSFWLLNSINKKCVFVFHLFMRPLSTLSKNEIISKTFCANRFEMKKHLQLTANTL